MKVMPATSLNYVELGDRGRPTVVLLHGMGVGHRMWQPQLAPLSERYHVIAPDLPGNAGSIASGPFTMTGAASATLDLLRERGRETAHLCGLSDGAPVALQIYLLEPSRVASLILSGSPPPTGNRFLMMIPRLILAALPLDTLLNLLFKDIPGTYKELVEAMKGDMRRAGKQGLSTMIREAGSIRFRESLRQINVPTLVLCGSKDGLGERKAAQELAASIPHAELQLIPEAGHIWNLERPELFTQTVMDFVQKVEGTA